MTIEEVMYCMKSYLPEDTHETYIKCKYYGSCKSNEAHHMAINALEIIKKQGGIK